MAKTVNFRFVADAIATANDTAAFSLTLEAGQQTILPNLVDHLRRQGVAGIGPANGALVGALFATPAEGDMSGIVIGARTGSPDGERGPIQPLLQRSALWLGLGRERLDLRAAAERREPQQPGPGQYG